MILNTEPHTLQTQGLVTVPTQNRETLVEGGQWTTIISKKKKKMKKKLGYHVIFLGTRKYAISTSLLTNFEEDQIILLAYPVLARGTRSGKAYSKQYDVTNPASYQYLILWIRHLLR